MKASVYNVIWADDECDTLRKDSSIRKLFDNRRIEVIAYTPTSELLKDAIENYKDKVDAIIVDGNFPKYNVEYLEPDDISGLIHTLSFIEQFNVKRDIPFFLYTARKVLLQEICKNGELDYFHKTKRLIQKGNIEILTDKIINDVDHIHSIEFLVKKNYAEIIKSAGEIDKSIGDNLHQFLLDEARDTKYNKSIDLFNQLRLIMEAIMENCKDNEFVPQEVRSLNNFKNFYTYSSYYNKRTGETVREWKGLRVNGKTYKPYDGIMPIPIGYSLEKLIDTIQDGSHKTQELDLHVSEYVQDANSPFLFRSCLYQVLDVIRWYGDINEKIKDGEIDGNKLYYTQ